MKVFEFKRFDYWPCQIIGKDELGKDIVEAVPVDWRKEWIDMWSVYGIQMDGSAFCVGDFTDEQTAAGLAEYFNNLLQK